MEELNNLENINFSGSPEYIDVFNDGISTLSEEYGTSPTACANFENGRVEITCAPSFGDTALSDNGACILAIENPTGNCTTAIENPGSITSTTYQVKFTFGIKVKSILLNGESGYTGNATYNGWGHELKLKYNKTSNEVFKSGTTYSFSYDPMALGPCYARGYNKTDISTSSDLRSLISTITGTQHTFIVVSMDGHDIPSNKEITCTVKYKSGTTNSTVTTPTFASGDTISILSLSAKTYSISYDSDTNISSSAFEKIIRNNIKIGTKFSVYDTDKTKTATTGNNSAYAYSVGYCTEGAPNYNFKPFHRFFINTSAETICVKQERCGESYETTIDLNPSSYIPILPPMQTSGKLATLKTLYDSSTGLGITSFQKMFSNEISSKGNMVLTPNQYQKLNIQDNTFNGIVYGYTKPTIYYSASTNSQNYCLKINDISTFDRYIYLATSTGMTNPNGTNISTQGIYVHNNFTAYKNYPLTNVKNEVEWTESGDEKKYFTFYL